MRSQERTEFLCDVITTAVEGGIGYWSQVGYYQYADKPEVTICVDDGHSLRPSKSRLDQTYAVIYEENEDGEIDTNCPIVLTIDNVASAIAIIMAFDKPLHVHGSYRNRIAGASAANDCGDLDALDCDVIIQVVAFGDVIYG